MRHWRAGLPLARGERVCGRPCGHWLSLFSLCHVREAHGWRRLAWPDGAPLLRQSWPLVQVFQVVAEEWLAAEGAEARRRRAR